MFMDFIKDETGAVSTDLVVLLGALVGLGLAVTSTISGGVENLSFEIADDFAAIDPSAPAF